MEELILPQIIELREYSKENNLPMLSTDVEVKLNKALIGFKAYWLNILTNPKSWKWDNGEAITSMYAGVFGKNNKLSSELIRDFNYHVDSLISEKIKFLLKSILSGRKECRLLEFYVDYEAYEDLGTIVEKLNSIEIDTTTFPCKTQSFIEIKNIELSIDGIVTSADIDALTFQGYRAPLKYINVDGSCRLNKKEELYLTDNSNTKETVDMHVDYDLKSYYDGLPEMKNIENDKK